MGKNEDNLKKMKKMKTTSKKSKIKTTSKNEKKKK
jgi:hypothetical protein